MLCYPSLARHSMTEPLDQNAAWSKTIHAAFRDCQVQADMVVTMVTPPEFPP